MKETRADVEQMRAADADRQKVADQLKIALDEGRLSLQEYDDRVRLAYASKTYQELLLLVTDLPRPGLNATEVTARRQAEKRKAARRLPTALLVLWTIWAAFTVVNLVVFGLVSATTDGGIYPWPIWLVVPGAALGVVTVGVQAIRSRR
ncbi:DUF1707 SHOCT-like domain-containing protein [Actinoplanes sp. CA-142083]|uniref:DUF1707 SHOCT-like domain-containing protein n=1 Tax=Actinoplanes sp. CA-142083 TaxID=3239903 RepID=UPI003D8B084A